MALRDDDTRPLRPASSAIRLEKPDYKIDQVAKSLWVNDSGLVTVNLIAEADSLPVRINIYGPGLIPIRVKAIKDTTAKDILALYG